MTVDQMIDDIIRREGDYVDHPADKGGPAKCGITFETYKAWVQSQFDNYYIAPRICELPPALQPFMFDSAVNHGPARAIEMLQQVCTDLGLDLKIDGVCGPITVKSVIMVMARYGNEVLVRLIKRRRQFYHDIVARDASQKVFLNGWLDRVNEFEPKLKPAMGMNAAVAELEMWKTRALKAQAARDEAQSALAYLLAQMRAAMQYVEK